MSRFTDENGKQEYLNNGDGDKIVKFTLSDTGDFHRPITGVTTEVNKGGGEVITGINGTINGEPAHIFTGFKYYPEWIPRKTKTD